MKSGVKLFSADVVGSRTDLTILVQNLATVEASNGGDQFKADVALFIQKLADIVKQQSTNLHPETVKLYQALARKKLKFDGGAYFIELPLHARVEALTFMLPIAQSLNIILYVDEPNYGYIFCPDGQILGGNGSTQWQDVVKHVDFSLYPFARNATEFKKIGQPAFAELAASHGFIKKKMPYMDNMGYMREFEGVSQYIGLEYGRSFKNNIDYVFYLPSIFITIDQVELIAEKFGFGDSDKVSLSFSSTGGKGVFSQFVRKWNIASLDEMQAVLAKLDQLIFTEICDHATNINDLDQLLNSDFESLLYRDMYDSGYNLLGSLILARLAGNPNFEKLVEHAEAKDWWGGKQKARKESWPELLKYLREEVKPIV